MDKAMEIQPAPMKLIAFFMPPASASPGCRRLMPSTSVLKS